MTKHADDIHWQCCIIFEHCSRSQQWLTTMMVTPFVTNDGNDWSSLIVKANHGYLFTDRQSLITMTLTTIDWTPTRFTNRKPFASGGFSTHPRDRLREENHGWWDLWRNAMMLSWDGPGPQVLCIDCHCWRGLYTHISCWSIGRNKLLLVQWWWIGQFFLKACW